MGTSGVNGTSGASSTSGSTGSFSEATWAEVNFDSDYSQSVVNGQIIKLVISSSVIPSFDQDAVRGFVVEYTSGSTAVFSATNLLSAFTTYNYTSGLINFYYTASSTATAGELAGAATVYYQKSTSQDGINVTSGNNQASAVGGNQSGRGDFEADGAFSVPNAESATQIVIPEINVRMQSQPITADEPRKTYEDDIFNCLFEYDMDGYNLAEYLKSKVYLEPDADLCAILDDMIYVKKSLEDEMLKGGKQQEFKREILELVYSKRSKRNRL